MPHRSKRLWLLHQHRSAYDLWDAPFGDLRQAPNGVHIRSVIRAADDALLPECEALYTISRRVSARLQRYNGLQAEPLYHPPPAASRLRTGDYGDYVLFPSRVNESKRQHLAVEALALAREPVRLCFIGAADAPPYQQALRARCEALGIVGQVEWRGAVDEAEKLALYAGCLAVMVPPLDEDYGYVTLEAMLSGKAVLTTEAAGGPLDFVVDGQTGLVCPPQPTALAAGLDRMWAHRAATESWGRAARRHYDDLALDWSHVLERLLG
jgi:glycosyltransferase involved in cell wall biosynthesis